MSASPLFPDATRRADCIWPGERVRRNGMVLQVEHVAVTPDEPVIITARQVDAPAGAEPMQIPVDATELLRIVA